MVRAPEVNWERKPGPRKRLAVQVGRAEAPGASSRTPADGPAAEDDDLAMFDWIFQKIIATSGRDVLRSGDALDAEVWVSSVLGMWSRMPLIGVPDTALALGGRLVRVASGRRHLDGDLCLRAVSAVGCKGLSGVAREALALRRPRRGTEPSWFSDIGSALATSAWRASDVWGDIDAVMIGFRYPSGTEHWVSLLVDHLLGGIAKDATVARRPLTDALEMWSGLPETELVELSVEEAAWRMLEAIHSTSLVLGPPISDDYRDFAALIEARVTPLAGHFQAPEPLPYAARERLVKDFLKDKAGANYARDQRAWFLLDELVDYRCDRAADPLRWSPGAVELFLLDFVPRKLTAEHETLAMAGDVLAAWVPWGAARAGLSPEAAAKALAVIAELWEEALAALADEANWGLAKTVAMRMRSDGVDLGDERAAQAWLARNQASLLAELAERQPEAEAILQRA
jgi:hypothetical protein